MKKINWKKKCRAAGRMAIAALTMFFLKANTVYASGISQSKLATGTQKQQGMPMPVQPGSLFSEKFMRRGVKTESEED